MVQKTAEPIAAAAAELAQSWEQEAKQRRQRLADDEGAAFLESCASELRTRVEQVERDTAFLYADQFAAKWNVTSATVRRLCAAGEIEGAIKGPDGEWRIPRTARRVRPPVRQIRLKTAS